MAAVARNQVHSLLINGPLIRNIRGPGTARAVSMSGLGIHVGIVGDELSSRNIQSECLEGSVHPSSVECLNIDSPTLEARCRAGMLR